MNPLGILEVVDLRTVWAHEALVFTRWLAEQENIQLLCNELDIEIEDIKMEESSGRYNADIVGIETLTKKKIIIENQLESTDHKHLGQIITYASGLDASIIIWIAKDYNEEHKAAIDWLNKNMSSEIKFFLIQIELWKIGNSLPAPKFNIISQPNDWVKTIESAAMAEKGSPSDLRLQQQLFWTQLKNYLKENRSSLNTGRSAKPQHAYSIGINSAKAQITLRLNSRQKQVSCELLIHNNKDLFAKMELDKVNIENNMGTELEWINDTDTSRTRISKSLDGDPFEESKWHVYFSWLKDTAEKFQKVFKPYINV
jgi:hypothetical protein